MGKIIPFPDRGGGSARGEASAFPRLYLRDLGLSDDQIRTLSDGRHEGHEAIFEVAPQLLPSDRAAAPVLRQTIALLEAIQTREPVRATAQGNLPTAIVKELFAGVFADVEPEFVRVNREGDSMVLSRVRWLAQKAGLLAFRAGTFRLTKAGRSALESGDDNAIYRRLLDAHLSAPRAVDAFDRIPVGALVADTVPLLLFAARDTNGEFLYEEDFGGLIWAVRDDADVFPEDLDHAVGLRFFERFGAHFGLFEAGPPFDPPVELPDHGFSPLGRWRRTALFDRALRWHVDPPPLAVQIPAVAVASLMYPIHESPDAIDGTEDFQIRRLCLRALERGPGEADPYVVLARLYSERPEVALSVADAGIAATRDTVPDVPDGVSPWRDHLFRDVIRLHLIRADSLVELDRLDEAYAEYETLLRIDPHDGIGAAEGYFLARVVAGEYEQARQLLDRFPEDRSATAAWNATLTAFARGDKDAAREMFDRAMVANPFVPECLLDRWPPEPPDYFSPGGVDEAVIYADSFDDAWRHVRGARDWLRRQRARHD